MRIKRVVSILGNILVLLSVIFIFKKIMEYRIDLRNIVEADTVLLSAVLTVVYAVMTIVLAKIFYYLLTEICQNDISQKNSNFIYCKANLYKYLPGNVFHYIGRNQIAVEESLKHSCVITATVAETILLILSALVVTFAFAGRFSFQWLQEYFTYPETLAIILLIMVCAIVGTICFRLYHDKNILIFRYFRSISKIKFLSLMKIIVAYTGFFIFNGILFTCLLLIVGAKLDTQLFIAIIGIHAFSWIVGFVTPGAPAGLGIRETMTSAMLSGLVRGDLVITAVILYRLVTIFGDLGGFLMTQLLIKRNGSLVI